tara:strand:+ start:612 stop:1814 length:1203 start_codon:yes stop_codon:yes gene_type:complete
MKKYYVIIFILGIVFTKSSADIQKEIDSNNNTLKKLEQTINKLEKDLESMESSERDLKNYIKILDEKIITREKQIAILIEQNKSISKLIDNSKENIRLKNLELKKLKAQLKQRAIYLYKNGKDKLISKLMLSNDWNTALNKLKYLKILLEYEKKLNNTIKLKIDELEKEKYNLESEQKNQKAVLDEAQIIHKSLKQDRNDKNRKIGKIKTDKDYLKKNLSSKKKEVSEIEDLIRKLILDVDSAKKREKALARERALQNKATSGNFAKMKGKLNPPTSGKVINKFGTHRNTKLSTITENIGIDIETQWNTPVYSVLDGVISVITYLRNYGNTIIISHGSGYFTVYANVEQISVKENDYILGNTKIGLVGKSENPSISNSYFLHFEIRKDETILNPEQWIKK